MEKFQALASLEAFLIGDTDIRDIIEVCHLTPKETWRLWTDRMGFALSVQRDKRIFTITEKQQTIIPDLHFKSRPKTIADKTKTALILYHSDSECCCFFLLGRDKRLRVIRYHTKWQPNEPPLRYGVSNLKQVVRSFSTLKIPSLKEISLPGDITPTGAALGPWPQILENTIIQLGLTKSPLVPILSELL